MDFARKQLEKYGWSDGKGLGKNENGIAQALKPKLKRNCTGIGHDAASEFTEHWWTTLYNKAADNVEVKEKNGKTKKIKRKDDKEFVISNSLWKLNKKSKVQSSDEQYVDYFVRTAVLTTGGAATEKVIDTESEDEVVEKKDVFKMTDEELFAACEGRTAHKGARHGLKASGKLARIEQQEQLLLNQPKYKGYSSARNDSEIKEIDLSADDLQVIEDITLNFDHDNPVKTKKKKKKRKRCAGNENNMSNIEEDLAKSVESLPKKLKKKRAKSTINIIENCDETDTTRYTESNKTRSNSNEVNIDTETLDIEMHSQPVSRKSKKKKKHKHPDKLTVED